MPPARQPQHGKSVVVGALHRILKRAQERLDELGIEDATGAGEDTLHHFIERQNDLPRTPGVYDVDTRQPLLRRPTLTAWGNDVTGSARQPTTAEAPFGTDDLPRDAWAARELVWARSRPRARWSCRTVAPTHQRRRYTRGPGGGSKNAGVSAGLPAALRERRLRRDDGVAVLGRGARVVLSGAVRSDPAIASWTSSAQLICRVATGIGGVFARMPLERTTWAGRAAVATIVTVEAAAASQWIVAGVLAGVTAVSYLGPTWAQAWAHEVREIGDAPPPQAGFIAGQLVPLHDGRRQPGATATEAGSRGPLCPRPGCRGMSSARLSTSREQRPGSLTCRSTNGRSCG